MKLVWRAMTVVALSAFAAGSSDLFSGPALASDLFPPGTATARATVGKIGLRAGAAINFAVGDAKAHYLGSQGNAESSAVGLGLIDLFFNVPIVCGRAFYEFIPPGSLPETVKVSSGDGPAQQRASSSFGNPGDPVVAATWGGSASPGTHAAADVQGLTLDLGGLVRVDGATIVSTADLTPGQQRAAHAVSEMSISLIDGAVRLDGLRWSADHRTGTDEAATGDFTVASASILGVRQDIDLVRRVLDAIGITLEFPQVVNTASAVEVTPMKFGITPPPQLSGPFTEVLTLAQPLRTRLLELVTPARFGPECGLKDGVGYGYLILDLLSVVLQNEGGVEFTLGGVSATTQAIEFVNPFGATGTAGPAPARTTAVDPAPSTAARPVVTRPELPARDVGAAKSVVERLESAIWCRTIHPSGSPGCSDGAGRLAGVVSLAFVGGTFAADRLRSKRSTVRPLHPEVGSR